MNNLKKSILGTYKAKDVDELLLKVRNDYEKCLKEQKDRIIFLRDDNRELSSMLELYRSNEKHIIDAIVIADETAKSIVDDAQHTADEILEKARNEESHIKTAVEGCCFRLYKLKRASEAIYRAVEKVMGENETERIVQHINIRPVRSVSSAFFSD